MKKRAMRSKLTALILAGVLCVPGGGVLSAEELTDGAAAGEEVVEEEISLGDTLLEGSTDDIQLSDYPYDEFLITGNEEAIKLNYELKIAGASSFVFQREPLSYYREILENGLETDGSSRITLSIDKFALIYLNDNDIPDLAVYSYDVIPDVESVYHGVSHVGFKLDGYVVGKSTIGSSGVKEQQVFYYPKKGITEEITVAPNDYFRRFNVINGDSSVYFFKSSVSENDNINAAYYVLGDVYVGGSYVYEEEYNAVYNTYVANHKNIRTPIQWVANTAENRDNYLGATQPVVSAPLQGLYNSSSGGDLRWTPVSGVDNYVVYRTNGGKTEKIATVGKDKTSYMDTSIKDNCWGKVYTYYVCSQVGNKISARENGVVLQRIAPMKINYCKNDKANAVTVKWAVSTGTNKAHGYELQYAESKEDLYGRKGTYKKVTLDGRNKLSRTISGLSKGKTYYFRVRAYVNYTNSVTRKTTKTWSQYSNVISRKITK